MNDFESVSQVKENAVDAISTAKDVIIQIQKGGAVIAAVKGGLKKAPGCPDSLKLLIDSPYGDMIVGLILHTTAPILTGSPTIIDAVKSANVAGAVALSSQFTFIQDAIENAIESIPGIDVMTEVVKEKVSTLSNEGESDEG